MPITIVITKDDSEKLLHGDAPLIRVITPTAKTLEDFYRVLSSKIDADRIFTNSDAMYEVLSDLSYKYEVRWESVNMDFYGMHSMYKNMKDGHKDIGMLVSVFGRVINDWALVTGYDDCPKKQMKLDVRIILTKEEAKTDAGKEIQEFVKKTQIKYSI